MKRTQQQQLQIINKDNRICSSNKLSQNKNPYCTEKIMIKSIEVLYRNKKTFLTE